MHNLSLYGRSVLFLNLTESTDMRNIFARPHISVDESSGWRMRRQKADDKTNKSRAHRCRDKTLIRGKP